MFAFSKGYLFVWRKIVLSGGEETRVWTAGTDGQLAAIPQNGKRKNRKMKSKSFRHFFAQLRNAGSTRKMSYLDINANWSFFREKKSSGIDVEVWYWAGSQPAENEKLADPKDCTEICTLPIVSPARSQRRWQSKKQPWPTFGFTHAHLLHWFHRDSTYSDWLSKYEYACVYIQCRNANETVQYCCTSI